MGVPVEDDAGVADAAIDHQITPDIDVDVAFQGVHDDAGGGMVAFFIGVQGGYFHVAVDVNVGFIEFVVAPDADARNFLGFAFDNQVFVDIHVCLVCVAIVLVKVTDIVHGNAGSAVGVNAFLDINVDFGIVVFDSQGVFPGGNAFFNRDVVFAFMVGTNVDIADDIGGFQLDDGFISIIAVSGVQIDLSVDVSVHVKIRGSAFLDRGVNAAVYERGVAKIAGNIGVGFAAADVHGDQIFDVAVNVRFTRAVFALEF